MTPVPKVVPSVILSKYLEMELLGCTVVVWLTSLETVNLFSTVSCFCASTKNGGAPAPLLSTLADEAVHHP